jgi:hypothetical protein
MRSLLGRFHRPFARSVEEQLLLLNNLGDGSTLSLDFTTGVLDPRLTFTRTTNATFINSQGLVQYAGQNLYFNTAFGGLSGTNPSLTSSGWTYAFSTGSATFHGDGSVTMTASSQRIGISRSSGFTGAGRRVIASVDILTVGDTGLTPSNLLITGTYTNGAHYVNSTLYTTGNVIGPCTLSFVFDSQTSGTTGAYFGVGMSGNSTATVKFANPRLNLWNGVVPAPYLENTSTTAERHDPRFDYDPSTLQPRGLLIEGTSNNLARYSETLETTGSFWGYNAATRTVESSDVNPTGGTGSISFAPTTNGGSRYCGLFLTGQTTTTAYTYSVWLKGKGTNICVISIQNSAGAQNATMTILSQPSGGTASVTSTGGGFSVVSNLSTTGWTRVQVVLAATLGGTGTLNVFMYPKDTSVQTTTDSLFAWGAQLEAGSGASSYIPTGASTGSRAADICYITNADYGFTTTGGTYFVEWERGEFATVSGQACNPFSTDYASGRWLGIGTAPAGTTATAGSWSGFLNATGAAVAGRNRAAVSYSSWVASASGVFRANGGSEIAGTLTLGTTPTYLMIGSASASAPYNGIGLRDFVNSRIRRIKYWPSVLPSATLQAITVNT